ncbi:MAG: DUF4167 domain-containing protein [Methylovirgula sp.]
MRGRNSSNRKGPNPLSRSYESNGPDVKIRGTAHHIGEKYLQLARDAQSSGDPVMAESFLQHAEHYFRLIAAAQASQQQAAEGFNRQPGEPEAEEFDDDEDFVGGMDRFASPIERVAPQPAFAPQSNGQPYPERQQRAYNGHSERPQYERPERGPRPERQDRQDRGERQDRSERPERNFQDRNYQDRGSYQDRNAPERNTQERSNPERSNPERTYPERSYQERPERQSRDGEPRGNRGGRGRDYRSDNSSRFERGEPRAAAEEIDGPKGLPAFITAPVRLQPEAHLSNDQPGVTEMLDTAEVENEGAGFHLRPRRRRRGKAELGEGPAEVTSARDPVGD